MTNAEGVLFCNANVVGATGGKTLADCSVLVRDGRGMPWSVVNFGKHRGKTLPQIVFRDPDWFFWSVEEDVFRDKPVLNLEAALRVQNGVAWHRRS